MYTYAGPRPTAAPLAMSDARPEPGYVLIPTALVADLADNLAAIGLYALVARRFLISHAPVPLSAADARRFDPALSPGASVRALARLAETGWLLEDASPGRKSRYAPTWGRIAGQARVWSLDAPRLGLPRRHHALRLDRRLLDLYIGRLDPHPAHPAQVTRYLTRPLLGLADVGAYARALAGFDTSTPGLARLGLVRDGQAQDLPDDAAILALASQQTLFNEGGSALSARGLHRLGVEVAPTPAVTPAQPLFFVPPGVIGGDAGGVIGRVIGLAPQDEVPTTASPRAILPLSEASERSPATLGIRASVSDSPPFPPHTIAMAGGGGVTGDLPQITDPESRAPATPRTSAPRHTASPPTSEAATLLQSLGVRPATVAELAAAPAGLVHAAVAHGQARPGVRDLAAWVVSCLRDARDHGWQIPEAPAAALPVPPLALATLGVEALLERAKREAPATLPSLANVEAACACDGSGSYLLDVPYGHPLWGKLQPCPCAHGLALREMLARTAGPALADASRAALRVDDRLYDDVTWGGRVFTPAEQRTTLRDTLWRSATTLERGHGVCLIGPPGSGKTTLAVATAREMAERHGLQLRYASVPTLLGELRKEVAERAPAQALQQHIDAPVLVLDDLGRGKLTAFAREKLSQLLDERLRHHTMDTPRLTFITSNLTFAELYALDAPLASRIATHTDVVLCVASDYRLHTAAKTEEALS